MRADMVSGPPNDPPAAPPLELQLDAQMRSRTFLVQRLVDVVCWPATRIQPNERELAADVLVGLLRSANVDQRRRCATRLAAIVDAPKLLLRYLARDDIDVARPLLEESKALDDADLVATIRSTPRPHWLAIAGRRHVGALVVEALTHTQDVEVIRMILRNEGAKLSHAAVQALVSQSRTAPEIARLLWSRPETSPAQALTMFWWTDSATRLAILRRFAVDRAVLCDELGDLFALCAKENWADPESRKAVALLERRQRNRAAAERSPHRSLEGGVQAMMRGVDAHMIAEISHMAGIRPATGARIFTDRGGEGIAVLCKATGLKRDMLAAMWTGLKRPLDDRPDSAFGRVLAVYETLATAKAQTVLRYWNWSLTTATATAKSARVDPDAESLEFAPARRSAALVFGLPD